MADQILITAQKKQDLEKELLNLKTVIRPNIGERLQAARALGDLSENAEYQTSRDEQGKNETRIQQIEHILKYGKIVERTGSDKVELGATVIVKHLIDSSEKTFLIVGIAEADITENKISIGSPLGKMIIGKTVGEVFTISTPRGEVSYEIISVV